MPPPEYFKQLYELKEKAKWSKDKAEAITAIKELARYGDEAMPALEEILRVTVSVEIHDACIVTINTVKENKPVRPDVLSTLPEKAAS